MSVFILFQILHKGLVCIEFRCVAILSRDQSSLCHCVFALLWLLVHEVLCGPLDGGCTVPALPKLPTAPGLRDLSTGGVRSHKDKGSGITPHQVAHLLLA